MKPIIYLLIVIFILTLTACNKDTTSTTPVNEVPSTTAMAIDSGYFSNGPYGMVTGTAKIYKTGNSYEIALENFSSSNGPDLKVYLSKEKQPLNFINLPASNSAVSARKQRLAGEFIRTGRTVRPRPSGRQPAGARTRATEHQWRHRSTTGLAKVGCPQPAADSR